MSGMTPREPPPGFGQDPINLELQERARENRRRDLLDALQDPEIQSAIRAIASMTPRERELLKDTWRLIDKAMTANQSEDAPRIKRFLTLAKERIRQIEAEAVTGRVVASDITIQICREFKVNPPDPDVANRSLGLAEGV